MFLALAAVLFVLFMIAIVLVTQQGMQLALFLTWSAMGMTVIVTLLYGILTTF